MPVKSVFHPRHGRVFFGCRRPSVRPKLRLRDYLDTTVKEFPGTPLVIDQSAKAMSALKLIYLNGTYGCCVPSGCEHVVGTLTGNATDSPIIFSDSDTETNYTGMSGGVFDPSDPNDTDDGCDPPVALQFWKSNGLVASGTIHKIAGSLGVDPTNEVELRAAQWLFENTCFAIELPDAWINPFPSGSGFTWDVAGAPDPDNGHWVIGVGNSKGGIQVDTWGDIGTLTYAAIAEYASEANGGAVYTVISQDGLVKAMNKFPNGLNWNQLVADFDSAGGAVTAN